MTEPNERAINRGKKLYVAQATLEYLIHIIISGSFLATITRQLGISDTLTGIISSFISLGCLFQLLSLFVHRPRSKPFVLVMTLINQVLYIFMYIIPLVTGNKNTKIILFVVCIFTAWLVYYFAHPKKMTWFMSLVDDKERGSFTANKEMVSLITGIIFQFAMGALVDYFIDKNQIRAAFIISAIVLFVLSTLQTFSMIFTPEKQIEHRKKVDFISTVKSIAKNKKVLKACLVCVIYYAASYASTPFHATYNINELGFPLKVVTAIAIVGNIARICVSRFWGKYADKNSFASMVEKCFIFFAIGATAYALATPKNALIPLLIYTIFHGISMGGINSALTNLIFDYAEPENRSDSLAVCQALSGLVGFLSTLAISPLFSYIQKNGNKFLGLPLYAQQVASFITAILTVFLIIYIRVALIEKKAK